MPATTHRPRPLGTLAALLLLLALPLLQARAGYYPPEPHTHNWSVEPYMEDPSISVDQTEPYPGARVRIDLGYYPYDYDTCTNPNCTFSPAQVPNYLRKVSWSASAGTLGYVNGAGDFVPSTQVGEITHLRCPNQTGAITILLTADDINQGTVPGTDPPETFPTADDPQRTGSYTLTVVPNPYAATWFPDAPIACSGITTPAASSTVTTGAQVSCGAGALSDQDKKEHPYYGQTTYEADTCTYAWSATGGSFNNPAAQNPVWTAPSGAGQYTLTLKCEDSNDSNKPEGDNGTRDDPARTFTVNVQVNLPQPTWSTYTPISGGITAPLHNTLVAPGSLVDCSGLVGMDTDERWAPEGTTHPGDPCTYLWSHNGGTFVGGDSTTTSVLWQAPAQTGRYTLTLKYDDQNDGNKPAGEGGSRNDTAQFYRVDVLVYNGSWEPHTGIECAGIQSPTGMPVVDPGQTLVFTGAAAADTDLRYENGAASYPADTPTYAWTHTGGTFVGGDSTTREVVWQAPAAAGLYRIDYRVNDQDNANLPAGAYGSRDDPPLTFSLTVRVRHYHQWTAVHNIPPALFRVDEPYPLPGERIPVALLDVYTDPDPCGAPACTFPNSTARNGVRAVAWEATAGKFGYYPNGVWTESTDPARVTHWEAPAAPGSVTLTCVSDETAVTAVDPETGSTISTFDDQPTRSNRTVKVVSHRHSWEAVHNIQGGSITAGEERPMPGERIAIEAGAGSDADRCTVAGCSFPGGSAPNETDLVAWAASAGSFGYYTSGGVWVPSSDPALIRYWEAPAEIPQEGLTVTLTARYDDRPQAYDPERAATIPTFNDEAGQSTKTLKVIAHRHQWEPVSNIEVGDFSVGYSYGGAPMAGERLYLYGPYEHSDRDRCLRENCPFYYGEVTNETRISGWEATAGTFGYYDSNGVWTPSTDPELIRYWEAPAEVPAAGLSVTITVKVEDTPTTWDWEAGETVATYNDQPGQRSQTVVVKRVTITTDTLDAGRVGEFYITPLEATGGDPPYSWSVAAGSLPMGLSLSSDGVISGTPGHRGTYTFTARVADVAMRTAQKEFALVIGANPPTITTTSLPDGLNSQPYETVVQATGGVSPYFWSVASSSLPYGLSLDAATGTISGTPASCGTHTFTLRVSDADGQTDDQELSIFVHNQAPEVENLRLTNTPTSTIAPEFAWEYSDPEGDSQSASVVRLEKQDGTVVQDWQDIGPTNACTGPDLSEDTYVFSVKVKDDTGVNDTSAVATLEFTVSDSGIEVIIPDPIWVEERVEVQARVRENGNPVSGVTVRFSTTPSDALLFDQTETMTDSEGIATVMATARATPSEAWEAEEVRVERIEAGGAVATRKFTILKLQILDGTLNNRDITNPSEPISTVVGREVKLNAKITPSLRQGDTIEWKWEVPDIYNAILNYTVAPDSSTGTVDPFYNRPELRAKSSLNFFWTNGGVKLIKLTAKSKNTKTVWTKLDVQSPILAPNSFKGTTGTIAVDDKGDGEQEFHIGYNPGFGDRRAGLTWSAKLTGPKDFHGQACYFQLTNVHAITSLKGLIKTQRSKYSSEGVYVADDPIPFQEITALLQRGITKEIGVFTDSPGVGAMHSDTVTINQGFFLYLMYRPLAEEGVGTIWVPVAKLEWAWGGTALKGNPWTIVNSSKWPNPIGFGKPSLEIPTWKNRFKALKWQDF
jgi:putative Ig domain-containing protein/Big-like domain-containing protein